MEWKLYIVGAQLDGAGRVTGKDHKRCQSGQRGTAYARDYE